ncbi:LysM domain-containing protein [Aliiglaciecola sp. LCG003]|uniref:LysM peptidoglycan-binding domain-containing protein n=1 Tax=Aliiglaciecola sp. LCG003 TaxID=3053655 RepID=UPI002572861D|nr:LysM domain-containing protein [Aliiglaciecola sp. LCG003]WJG09477.1 LysM domain-containing protein [Aliiglaciecola sp. LCG003]
MGKKLIKLLVILLFLPLVSLADVINIKGSAPEVYVVKKGDTLWDISSLYLDKPWLWPELWRNNVHIDNPHLIYPGDELRLRYNAEGEPQLEMVRETPKTQIKLSPQGHKVMKQAEPIPALPWTVIQPYIENSSIMSDEEYQRLPHLLGNQEGAVRYVSGDLVLSRAARRTPGRYNIIRKQNPVLDQYGNLLGIQIRHVADAVPLESEIEGQHLVELKQANFEAKRGDKLLPAEDIAPQNLELHPATRQKGQIVDSLEQHQLLGKYNVVVLDLGEREVKPGTVFGIYLQGPDIYDGESPKYDKENGFIQAVFDGGDEVAQPFIKAGEVVVFKVFEKASYALITRSTKVIRKGALVAKP